MAKPAMTLEEYVKYCDDKEGEDHCLTGDSLADDDCPDTGDKLHLCALCSTTLRAAISSYIQANLGRIIPKEA